MNLKTLNHILVMLFYSSSFFAMEGNTIECFKVNGRNIHELAKYGTPAQIEILLENNPELVDIH